jgi:SfnB family sulfur acquisition oxidoreductase
VTILNSIVRYSSHAEALAIAGELASRFAAGAAERDRHRLLPHAEVEELSASGLLAIIVPAELGGPGLGLSAAADVLRVISAADPSIGQVPQSHFVYLYTLLRNGDPDQRRFFASEIVAGRRIGNAQSEAGTKYVGEVRTRLRRTGSGLVLDGVKHYTTGAYFAHWVGVLALDDDDRQVVAYVPAGTAGLSVIDDWDGMGQRTTASGTVVLESVPVAPEHVIPHYRTFDGPQVHGAFAQLLHTGIDAGIARGALTEAATFIRTKARPWFEAEVDAASEDALTIQRFGDLEIEVRAAEALFAEAGRVLDAVGADPTEAVAAAVSVAVATAKVAADRAAISVANAVFELGGTRSSLDSLNLNRHWRNARTHTLHDPVRWKVQHIGRYALNGTLPPRHGVL